MSAADIARGLGLRRSGRVYTGRCPCCAYNGAFTVQDRGGVTLVRCHVGCGQRDAIDALRRDGLWPRGRGGDRLRTPIPAGAARTAAGGDTAATASARALWDRAVPPGGPGAPGGPNPVARYLARRGYTGPIPPALRHLPDALHRPTGTRWPAMLAAVACEPTGTVVAVHRTYLHPDGTGKASVEPARMTLGPVGGGAVRLVVAGERLAVTEGIETGLSVLAATGVPSWAALSAGGIRGLILPPLPLAAEVTVCADNDPVGRAAAHDAAKRWHHEGRRVRIALPPEPGSDFNDLARATGDEP